jgi:hypothetical protein
MRGQVEHRAALPRFSTVSSARLWNGIGELELKPPRGLTAIMLDDVCELGPAVREKVAKGNLVSRIGRVVPVGLQGIRQVGLEELSSCRALQARTCSNTHEPRSWSVKPPMFSTSPASARLTCIQVFCTASSASASEPSIRQATARRAADAPRTGPPGTARFTRFRPTRANDALAFATRRTRRGSKPRRGSGD